MRISNRFGATCACVSERDIREAIEASTSTEEGVQKIKAKLDKKNVDQMPGNDGQIMYFITYLPTDGPVYVDCEEIVAHWLKEIEMKKSRKLAVKERQAKNLAGFLQSHSCSASFSAYLQSLGEKDVSGLIEYYARHAVDDQKKNVNGRFVALWHNIVSFPDAILSWSLIEKPALTLLLLKKALILSKTKEERAILKDKLSGKYRGISDKELLVLRKEWKAEFKKAVI